MHGISQIIIISDFASVNGGATQVAVCEAMALAAKGHQVTFLCAVDGFSQQLAESSVRVVSLHQYDILTDPDRFRAVIQGLWNRKAELALGQLLDSCDPQTTIVHLHSWTKALSSSVARTAIRKGFSAVCTMHDFFLACPNGGFFNYKKNNICSLNPLSAACLLTDCDARSYSQKCWRLARQVIQKYFGRLPYGLKHLVAVSDFSRAILRPYIPVDARIYAVNNPVNVVKTQPVDVANNDLFAYVGRLSKEKGCTLFAEAARLLAVKSIFIGDGELRGRVLELAPDAAMSGWLQHDQMLETMQSAKVLVFPSLWYETQGLVVIEALARGIPVLVSDTSAARELVQDGVTGLWFKSGNLADLMDKMRVISTPGLAGKMGRTAYQTYWSSPSTIEGHIEQLEQCYRTILGVDDGVPERQGSFAAGA